MPFNHGRGDSRSQAIQPKSTIASNQAAKMTMKQLLAPVFNGSKSLFDGSREQFHVLLFVVVPPQESLAAIRTFFQVGLRPASNACCTRAAHRRELSRRAC